MAELSVQSNDRPLHIRTDSLRKSAIKHPPIELIQETDDERSSEESAVKSERGDIEEPYQFNPFHHHRRLTLPTNKNDAIMHMIKGSLGFGLFAMPLAFKFAGMFTGLIGTVLLCCVVWHCMHIFVKTSHDVCTKMRLPMLGYSKTVEIVLDMGPQPLPKYAYTMRQILDFSMILSYLSTSYVYMVIVSRAFRHILFDQFNVVWSARRVSLVLLPGFVCIGQIRQLKVLVPFSMAANVLLATAFSLTIYVMLSENETARIGDKPKFRSWKTLPNFISITLFTLDNIGAVMPISNSMTNPEKFLGCPGVLNTAMCTLLVMYLLMGYMGYSTYGNEILASVTMNLRGDTILIPIVQYVFILGLILTFGLYMYIIMDIIWPKLHNRVSSWWHLVTKMFIRLMLTLSLASFVFIFPDVVNCMDLIGSIYLPFLGIIIPAFMQTVFVWSETKNIFCNYVFYKNLTLIIAAVVFMVTGCVASINQMVQQYQANNMFNFIT